MTEIPKASNRSSIRDTFLAIFALNGFAIAQPVFDIFSRSPEFFIIRRTSVLELVTLTTVLLLLIPGILVGLLVSIRRLSSKAGDAAFFSLCVFFYGLISLPILHRNLHSLNKHADLCIGIAIGLGLCAAGLYFLSTKFRDFHRVAAFAPIIFGVTFFYSLNHGGFFAAGERGGPAADSTPDPKPTFLVIFDEFPLVALLNKDREINSDRFPGFKELASLSTWYRNGTTVSSWTEHAVPVILSGRYPNEKVKELPSLKFYPQNVFTLFSRSHDVTGYEQVTHLCPDELCTASASKEEFLPRVKTLVQDATVIYLHYLLPKSKRKLLPDISAQWGEFLKESPETQNRSSTGKMDKKGLLDKGEWSDDSWLFSQFIESIRVGVPRQLVSSQVPFYMIHITFPHVPYRYLPDGSKYLHDLDRTNENGYRSFWGEKDSWFALQAWQRLIMQAGAADKMISELLATLRQVGILDQSIVVVAADHGTSFQVGQFARRVTGKNVMDILPVPFFIKSPGQRVGEISDRNVETIDILPTLLDLNKIKPSDFIDGSSVIGDSTTERPRKVYVSHQENPPRRSYPKSLSFEPTLTKSFDIFGGGGFDERFYSIASSHKDILGKSIGDIQKLILASAIIDNPQQYSAVERNSGYIPAYIFGRLDPKSIETLHLSPGSKCDVAIILNGKVQAVTQSYAASRGIVRFGAVVNPESLLDGENKVEAYILRSGKLR